MKKLLLIVIAVIMAISASAQERKVYLGFGGIQMIGDISMPVPVLFTGFTQYKRGDYTYTGLGIVPEIGYFISNRFAVGLGLGVSYKTYKYEGEEDYKRTSWGVNPYVRYYAVKTERFGLYLQGGGCFVSSKYDGDDKADEMFYAGIRPGVSYNISDRFAINASFGDLGYYDYGDSSSAINLSLQPSTLLFGLTVAF